ncbi:MAG: L-threonylcarbamoyladenylate synthase [Chloroflexota bacterium]
MRQSVLDHLRLQAQEAVRILRNGGVVAVPTDTVYGLAANAQDPAAIDRIFEIKERPSDLSLPLFLHDADALPSACRQVADLTRFFAGRFWPGALTLVVPAGPSLPRGVTRNGNVAVRVPDHALCQLIVRQLGRPITGTSANMSGRPPAQTPEEVKRQLGKQVDLVIDGGRCPGGVSTIVDLTGEAPAVLRAGIVPEESVRSAYEEYLAR